MDYKEQIEALENLEAVAYCYSINGEVLGMDCVDFEQIMVYAAESITDLLARAEAAEVRAEKAERAVAELMGISPQERITTCFGHPIDRVMELVKADREERCVVLPCKTGDHMFEIFCGKVREIIVCGFSIRNKREVVDYMRMHGGYVQCAAIEMDLDLFTREMYKTREAAETALKGERDA